MLHSFSLSPLEAGAEDEAEVDTVGEAEIDMETKGEGKAGSSF